MGGDKLFESIFLFKINIFSVAKKRGSLIRLHQILEATVTSDMTLTYINFYIILYNRDKFSNKYVNVFK